MIREQSSGANLHRPCVCSITNVDERRSVLVVDEKGKNVCQGYVWSPVVIYLLFSVGGQAEPSRNFTKSIGRFSLNFIAREFKV